MHPFNPDEDFFVELCHEVGSIIKHYYYYYGEYKTYSKEDKSPLTSADLESHKTIVAALKNRYPTIPVLSEESQALPEEERKKWSFFWLVDPLDGTKEFIHRQDEFTVNIALINNSAPIFGVIYIPIYDTIYMGFKGKGSWKIKKDLREAVTPSTYRQGKTLKVGVSRFHLDDTTKAFLQHFKDTLIPVVCGSALKFCFVADGSLDLYLRFGPTWEWDTGAGQAIVEASGGGVVDLRGQSLQYNKATLKNGPFVVTGNVEGITGSALWQWIESLS